MRLVVWNCTMRLHEKVGALLGLRPDVAVVPECACPEILLRRAPEIGARSLVWEGRNPSKGLAVMSFGRWRLDVDARHVAGSGTTLPVHVRGPARFRLLAVWALPRWACARSRPPPEPLSDAVTRLGPFLAAPPAIVAGDFHQTLVRRAADRALVPSRLARRFGGLGFASAYHLARGVSAGHEPEPTFFRHRRIPGRHHVDHVLLDGAVSRRLKAVEIGAGRSWIPSSDHVPLVVELELDGEATASMPAREGGVDSR